MAIISVRGPKGSGKSTLGANWKEGRTFWIDLELGAMRALSRVKDWQLTTELWHPYDEATDEATLLDLLDHMNLMRGQVLTGRVEYWESIVKKYLQMCATNYIDNIIFDTWKEVWSSNTQAFLQKVQEGTKGVSRQNLIQIEYGTPNARMNSVISTARKFGKELMLISHERPVYVYGLDAEGKTISYPDPSGAVELDGYKNTLDLVDWAFQTAVVTDCELKDTGTGANKHKCSGFHFEYTIEKSPVDASHVGYSFLDLTYEKLEKFVVACGYVMV